MVETEVQGEGSFLGCASSRIPGKNAASAKSDQMVPRHRPRKELYRRCTECGSPELWKDGLRYSPCGDNVQRWLCRTCGHRFTEPGVKLDVTGRFEHVERRLSAFEHVEISHTKAVKATAAIVTNCQICAIRTEAKNLAEVEKQEEKSLSQSAGATKADPEGLITQFMAWCEAEGYSQYNTYHNLLRKLVRLGADLLDPEDVKKKIGSHQVRDGSKLLMCYAYDAFTKMLKITWNRPTKYKQEEKLPFVPTENEADQLIAGCRSRRMAAFLQCLKETYADPGEALQLEWIDITGNVVTINHPVKGHLPGQIEVSNKLIAMLNALPKTSKRIFNTNYRSMFRCYDRVRKHVATTECNQRILSIQFRSYRHLGGSMIAHYTNGNVLTVKKLLRHKRIENTMKYISMIDFKDDEFEITTATTLEEIEKAGAAGFQKFDEFKGIHVFRRPKRFSKLCM